MIRGFSLFIAILFLASNAGAAPLPASEQPFATRLREISGAGIRGFSGVYYIPEPQITQINISFRENVATDSPGCGSLPCKIAYTLTDFPSERAIVPGTSSDRFDFDTVSDCDILGTAFVWTRSSIEVPDECFDQAWTQYSFGGSWAPVNGLEVDFLHTLSPTDTVETNGSIVFQVTRDITYILSGSYGIEGDGIARLNYSTQLLELRDSEPREGDTVSAVKEWFYVVNENGGVSQTVMGEEFSNVEYTIGDTTECWGCPGGQNQYFGILKAYIPYRLAWSTQVWRTLDASSVVEPTGHLSFVVPEPSSNLMGFVGILGVAFLGRRRALQTKVS